MLAYYCAAGESNVYWPYIGSDVHSCHSLNSPFWFANHSIEACIYSILISVQAIQESMKSMLDMMASFTMMPCGFLRCKGRVTLLCERVMSMTRIDQQSASSTAQRLVSPQQQLTNSKYKCNCYHRLMGIPVSFVTSANITYFR